jgi:hypothetical protein
MGVGGQRHAPAVFTPGKDPVPIVQEAGWAPWPVWMGVENLAHTGIPSPDHPALSESLYQLRYPGPLIFQYSNYIHVARLLCCLVFARFMLHNSVIFRAQILIVFL